MWANDDKHPFAGIATKLKRADESIVNLNSEILAFLQASKYPVIPNADDKDWQSAVNYHKDLVIPKRFSVLAGEIVHHFRSCLDHIVWLFSNDNARRLHGNVIEFPVISETPNKDKKRRFDAQIQGVDKPSVRKLILAMQPYHLGASAADHALCIIHNMDRFDKHRELVIVTSCANVSFPEITPNLRQVMTAYAKTKTVSPDDARAFQRAVKYDARVTPQVAFANFGSEKGRFVVPSLVKLLNATGEMTNLFAGEL